MADPIFTIIMSTYNRRDLLPRAIQSVLNQTFTDFELLVIDNGSTDDTPFVVKAIKDPRLRYIRNPSPTNSCDGPRNLGIEMAKGRLISFLDDDDIWYPQRLEKVKNAFDENPDASAVCHSENRRINGRIDAILRHGPSDDDIYETLLYERNCLSTCAMTIKVGLLRELNGFNLRKEFDAAADYDLWLRMAARGPKIHFIDEPLGEFCVTGNNGSIADPSFDSKVAFLLKEHMLTHEKKTILKVSKKGKWRLFQLYYIAARSFARSNDYKNFIKCLGWSIFFILSQPRLLPRLIAKFRLPS